MTIAPTAHDLHVAHAQQENDEKAIFGFWIYLMTDCVLFATLFATYAVLHTQTFGGPSGRELFSLPYALAETMVLLVSSFFCGFLGRAAYFKQRGRVLFWMGMIFVLGATFLALELHEFADFVQSGNSWQRSAFLSSFFTLVGCHGFHITCGLAWMIFLGVQIFRRGIIPDTVRRLICFKLFWHFLDVVWIFIFSIVYIIGAA